MPDTATSSFTYIFFINFSLKILWLGNLFLFLFLSMRKHLEFTSCYMTELRLKSMISDSKSIAFILSIYTFKDLSEIYKTSPRLGIKQREIL